MRVGNHFIHLPVQASSEHHSCGQCDRVSQSSSQSSASSPLVFPFGDIGLIGRSDHGSSLLASWSTFGALLLEAVFLLQANKSHATCCLVDSKGVGCGLVIDLW